MTFASHTLIKKPQGWEFKMTRKSQSVTVSPIALFSDTEAEAKEKLKVVMQFLLHYLPRVIHRKEGAFSD